MSTIGIVGLCVIGLLVGMMVGLIIAIMGFSKK